MRKPHWHRWLVAAILPAALAPRAVAGSFEKLTANAQHFGTFSATTRINAAAFLAPDYASQVNNRVVCDGALYCRGAAGLLIVPLDLPNGAQLVSAYLYLVDNDCGVNGDVTFTLLRYFDDYTTGANEGAENVASVSSSGCQGYQQISISPGLIIRAVDDVDNDVAIEAISHVFMIQTPSNTTAVRALELNWVPTVKPAPALAQFDDVPTNHPAFREIEALYASGATAGCDNTSDNYCPDNPVTRAQLAVMLAKLLGLSWPK
jgi:hypothetical protein